MNFPRRQLGRTGEQLSIIGFGGIVVMDAAAEQAAKVVSDCIEKGINYFDVAPSYGDAEAKLGPALEPYREKVFLACKTICRDRKGAKQELDNSLKNLKTDYFDLYQMHGFIDVENDVKAALSKDGAIQTFLEARKAGIIKYIGFSAHSPEAALTAMREFEFDTVLYPINFCTHFASQLETEVIAEAKKRGMGILALKVMAKQTWAEGDERKACSKCWYEPIEDKELAGLAISWALSQGVTAVVSPADEELLRMAMELAPHCKELTEDEIAKLKTLAADLRPIFSA